MLGKSLGRLLTNQEILMKMKKEKTLLRGSKISKREKEEVKAAERCERGKTDICIMHVAMGKPQGRSVKPAEPACSMLLI